RSAISACNISFVCFCRPVNVAINRATRINSVYHGISSTVRPVALGGKLNHSIVSDDRATVSRPGHSPPNRVLRITAARKSGRVLIEKTRGTNQQISNAATTDRMAAPYATSRLIHFAERSSCNIPCLHSSIAARPAAINQAAWAVPDGCLRGGLQFLLKRRLDRLEPGVPSRLEFPYMDPAPEQRGAPVLSGLGYGDAIFKSAVLKSLWLLKTPKAPQSLEFWNGPP